MDYAQIILEMLDRIKTLESKVSALEKRGDVPSDGSPSPEMEKISAKYRGLTDHLYASGERKVVLTYAEIEAILGFPLPDTARNFKKSFWANTATHSYASAWMALGYKAHVDAETDTVTFTQNLRERPQRSGRPFTANS